MAQVLFKFGTPEAYAGLGTYEDNALYFIQPETGATEGVLYKGSVRYSPEKQVQFTSTTPTNPESNKIYVVNDGAGNVSIVVSDGAGGSTVVGGGTVAEGAITDIGAFDESVLITSSELSEGVLPEGDTTIPTSGAVKTAIEKAISEVTSTSLDLDGAFTDVVAETAPEGTNGTVLKFTTKGGETKSVTVADLFLTAASYDSETRDLTLTVGSGESATSVVIPLDELVPQAVNASQVAMAREITVTTTVGNLKAGDKVILSGDPATGEVKAADVQALFEAILSKDINPTTTQPSASVTLTGAGAKEVGSTFTPSYSASLNPGKYSVSGQSDQASGVTATSYSISDTNSNSSTTASGSFAAFTVEDSTNYKITATINYGDGNIPKTFLGNDYAAGQIKAGSKSATSSAVTGYRQMFYGASTSAAVLDSVGIRALAGHEKAAKKAVTFTAAEGSKQVLIAFPSSLTTAEPTFEYMTLGWTPSSGWEKSTAQVSGVVAGANMGEYTVWKLTANLPADTQYRITIK